MPLGGVTNLKVEKSENPWIENSDQACLLPNVVVTDSTLSTVELQHFATEWSVTSSKLQTPVAKDCLA